MEAILQYFLVFRAPGVMEGPGPHLSGVRARCAPRVLIISPGVLILDQLVAAGLVGCS